MRTENFTYFSFENLKKNFNAFGLTLLNLLERLNSRYFYGMIPRPPPIFVSSLSCCAVIQQLLFASGGYRLLFKTSSICVLLTLLVEQFYFKHELSQFFLLTKFLRFFSVALEYVKL